MNRLIGLYLPTLAISFAQGMIFPAVPALATHFGVSPGFAAQVVSAQVAGRMLGLLPSGALVDRLGPRAALILGSLVVVAGPVCMLAPAFWAVLLGQVLLGLGSSLWLAGREITGLNLVREDQRGRLMSGFFGLQMGGLAAGPLMGGVVIDTAGLTALFVAVGVIGVAVLALTLSLRLSPARSPARPAALPAASGGWREILPGYRATFTIVVVATFTMSLYRSSLNSLLPLYAGGALGFSATQVGALFGIISVGVIAMIVPAGLLLDRMGRKWGAVPAAALPALALSAMPFARTGPQLSILAAVLGVANGVALGSMSTYSYDVIPEHARGVLQAQRRLVGDFGGLLGPTLGGLMVNLYEVRISFLVYAPVLTATALLLAFGARETLRVSAVTAARESDP
jgi:MFS family permease